MTYVTYIKNNNTAKETILEHYDFEDVKICVSNINLNNFTVFTHIHDNSRKLTDIIEWNK